MLKRLETTGLDGHVAFTVTERELIPCTLLFEKPKLGDESEFEEGSWLHLKVTSEDLSCAHKDPNTGKKSSRKVEGTDLRPPGQSKRQGLRCA